MRLRDPKHLARVRLLPCCLSGWHRSDAKNDAAHIRRFSGMGIKPPDNHVVPLRHELHLYGEHARGDFWERAGFPWDSDNDPRIWAERLYECAPEEQEALVWDMMDYCNTTFVSAIVRRIAA